MSANPSFTGVKAPLQTRGRHIIDSEGEKVKLHCVNWAGAEQRDGVVAGLQHQPMNKIAQWIAKQGFNCVRFPWSVWMVLTNPEVNDLSILRANPHFQGSKALKIFDAVIAACGRASLVVILDNHMSDGDWCCSEEDQNGLWYNERWPETAWLKAHTTLAKRYAKVKTVVGMELRNELRPAVIKGKRIEPTWGSGDAKSDWRMAVMKGREVVHKFAAHWLIVVDGLDYSSDFLAMARQPLSFKQLIYAPHDYSWFHADTKLSYKEVARVLDSKWGFLLKGSNAAPVWVSEFGTYHDGRNIVGAASSGSWWTAFTRYVKNRDLGWAYWRLDGTESRGRSREFGAVEEFGLLNASWDGAAASGILLHSLQELAGVSSVGAAENDVPSSPSGSSSSLLGSLAGSEDLNLAVAAIVVSLCLVAVVAHFFRARWRGENRDLEHMPLHDDDLPLQTEPRVVGAAVHDDHFEIGEADDDDEDFESDEERFWQSRV